MSGSMVDRVYRAKSADEQEAVYDDWSQRYEPDLCALGYRLPAMAAAVFTRFVPAEAQPILDAGCGGGLQAEALAAIGYGPIIGIDLSEGMLAVARAKGIYAELRRMALGERLDFADASFAAILSMGTLTPGHAPAESLDELLRVARPGARIVFSLRSDPGQDPSYDAACRRIAAAGRWRHLFSTPSFMAMPYGEAHVTSRLHAYEVI
jgi:SAM-dependent methyltransferase